jgi:hypothetical protein
MKINVVSIGHANSRYSQQPYKPFTLFITIFSN